MTVTLRPSNLKKLSKRCYRGSGTLAMCGKGPHPGGALFRNLCTLADRFGAYPEDPTAQKIGSILSLLAFYATKPNDRDFRYSFGSFVMDLALAEEAEPTLEMFKSPILHFDGGRVTQ